MRFVSPETVRIHLADGSNGDKNWIEVKKDLTAGEEKKFRSAGLRRVTPRSDATAQSDVDVDWTAMALARVETYLTDWSAAYSDDPKAQKSVPIDTDKRKRDAIESLETESFDEIDTAIQKHIEQRTEEKKLKTNSPLTIATSA